MIFKKDGGKVMFGLNEFEVSEEYLYHYTSAEGLFGILNTKQLWVTHSAFLNDPTELRNFQNSFYALSEGRSMNENKALQLMHVVLTEESRHNDYYICSFSSNPDCLPLWTNYGKTGGYAIKFKTSKLKNIFERSIEKLLGGSSGGVQLLKVIYNDDEKKKILVRGTNNVFKYWSESQDHIKGKDSFYIVEDILGCCKVSFKEQGFSPENEIRAIIKTPAEVLKQITEFRSFNGCIIPFLKIDLKVEKDCGIEGICIGPRHFIDLETVKDGLARYIESLNLDIPVSFSSIPLRF